jgi:hypothetical protein
MNQYVSSQSIVGDMISNYGISIANKEDDFISWIGDAVQAIGFGTYTVMKTEEMSVNDYRVEIPHDLIYLVAMVSGTKCVNQVTENRPLPSAMTEDIQLKLLQEIVGMYEGKKYVYSTEELADIQTKEDEEDERVDSMLTLYRNTKEITKKSDLKYQMNFNYIKTNVEEGKVILWYKAMMLDDEGYPAILDTYKFREAVRLFTLQRLLMTGYQHPTLNLQIVMPLTATAITAARNERKQFTNAQQKEFVRNWTNPLFLNQYQK